MSTRQEKGVKTITIDLEESAYEIIQKIASNYNTSPSEWVTKYLYHEINMMNGIPRKLKIKDGLSKSLVRAYLSEDVYKKIESYAKEDNVGISEFVETMLTFYLQDNFTKESVERFISRHKEEGHIVLEKRERKELLFNLEFEDHTLMIKIASEHKMFVSDWIDELLHLHARLIYGDMQRRANNDYQLYGSAKPREWRKCR